MPDTFPLVDVQWHRGTAAPLGVSLSAEGANFSVFSTSATGLTLLLFDHADAPSWRRSIRFDLKLNRTGHYWHIFIPGVRAGQIYGYRAEGPDDPPNGQRFDGSKTLLDPYGRGVAVGATIVALPPAVLVITRQRR